MANGLLRTVFEADVGVETEPLERTKGGYVWVDVLEVIPEREKTIDEVKPALTEAYIAAEKSKALSAKADELIKRANAGEDLAKLATEMGGTVKTSEPLTRSSAAADLPETTLPLAFSLAKDGAAWTPSADDTQRVIFRLKNIVPAAPLAEETQQERRRTPCTDARLRRRQRNMSAGSRSDWACPSIRTSTSASTATRSVAGGA